MCAPRAACRVPQDPLIVIFIDNATMVSGDSSPFECLPSNEIGTGLLAQFTNVLIPPKCGQDLLGALCLRERGLARRHCAGFRARTTIVLPAHAPTPAPPRAVRRPAMSL